VPISRKKKHGKRAAVVLAAASSLTSGAMVAEALVALPFSAAWAECSTYPSTADPGVLETVYRTGRGLGVDDRVMLAGFEAGWVESRMNNLNCGDRDSLGVFQQRPSQGWGTPAQIMDVSYASNSFFTRAIPVAANNPSWSAGRVAQAVQRSAFPERYDQSEGTARNLIGQAKDLVTGKVTVGFYQPAARSWHLKNSHAGGSSDVSFLYGVAGAKPVTGDWNNDGKTSIGYYNPANGGWYLRDTNNAGPADYAFTFGPANMVPLTGDWDNDGKTTIGYYNPGNGTFHLRNTLGAGPADHSFAFGPAGMVPVAGDWNNDGKTTVGFYNPANGNWQLRDSQSGGAADHNFVWRQAGMTPVTGDWNADGKTTIGFYNPGNGNYLLRNSLSAGAADHSFVFGSGGQAPVTGDWNND
jgi:hypothetical protein